MTREIIFGLMVYLVLSLLLMFYVAPLLEEKVDCPGGEGTCIGPREAQGPLSVAITIFAAPAIWLVFGMFALNVGTCGHR